MTAKPATDPFPFNRRVMPLLIILSGPSGAGKDAVLARMKELNYPFTYITTKTTRNRRPAERDKVDYHFVSVDAFQKMVDNHDLLEWAKVYGNWYGVPRSEVKKALAEGQDTVIKVDVQGAMTIKKSAPQAVSIFLIPSSMDDLAKRLKQRHTESPADLTLRLKTCRDELERLPLFDYVVVNPWDRIDRAAADIMSIVRAEKCRVKPRQVTL